MIQPDYQSHSPKHPFAFSRPRVQGLCLGALLFSAGISTTGVSLINNRRMVYHQLVFIALSFLLARPYPSIKQVISRHRGLTACVALWLISMTVSLLTSPYHVAFLPGGLIRLLSMPIHVVFALCVWDYFRRVASKDAALTAGIAAAGLYVALIFVLAWYGIYGIVYPAEYRSEIWWYMPPLNAHIRHTGYLVTAGLVTVMALTAAVLKGKQRTQATRIGIGIGMPVLTLLWTFLFWLGGRGAIVSVIAVVLMTVVILWRHGIGVRPFMSVVISSAVIGCGLAELLAVFPWNGIWPSFQRTVAAKTLAQVSTGRTAVWGSTLTEVSQYPLFGLGPEGYRYMPSKIWGVHPHCFLIQFLAEWGLAGTIPFLIILGQSIRVMLNRLIVAPSGPLDARLLVGGALVCALTLYGLVDGTYYHGQPSLYLAFAFGMALSAVSAPKQYSG